MSPTHHQDTPEGQEQGDRHQDGQAQESRDRPADTGARPDEILRDGMEQGALSDEEAVLAYNANAEDGDPEEHGAAGETAQG